MMMVMELLATDAVRSRCIVRRNSLPMFIGNFPRDALCSPICYRQRVAEATGLIGEAKAKAEAMHGRSEDGKVNGRSDRQVSRATVDLFSIAKATEQGRSKNMQRITIKHKISSVPWSGMRHSLAFHFFAAGREGRKRGTGRQLHNRG